MLKALFWHFESCTPQINLCCRFPTQQSWRTGVCLTCPQKDPGPLRKHVSGGTCFRQAEVLCCLWTSPSTGGCGWAPKCKGSTNKYGPQVFSTSLKCDDLVKDQESEIEMLGTSLSPWTLREGGIQLSAGGSLTCDILVLWEDGRGCHF